MSAISSTVAYRGNQDIIGETEREGFFLLRDFFDRGVVDKARTEMAALLDRDVAERERTREKKPVRMEHGKFQTSLTNMMHTRLFPTWESPTFAQMTADLFDSQIISDFMGRIVGEHYRLRVDLIRRSTGVDNTVDSFQIPHEWHRDTAGEFTFGVFFDDVSKPSSGGTAVIPGTHWEKLDPRWDLYLATNGRPLREDFLHTSLKKLPDKFYPDAAFNHQVRKEVKFERSRNPRHARRHLLVS